MKILYFRSTAGTGKKDNHLSLIFFSLIPWELINAFMLNIKVSVGSNFTWNAFAYMVFDLGLFISLQMLLSPCEQVPYSVADIAVGAIIFILTVKLVHNIRRQVERWKTFQWKIRFNFESTIYNINLDIISKRGRGFFFSR